MNNVTNSPVSGSKFPSPVSNKITETKNNNLKELKSLVQFFNGQAWISDRKKLNHLVQKFSDLSKHLEAGVNKEDVDFILAEIGRMKDSCVHLKENRKASIHLKKINKGIRSLEDALPLKQRASSHPKKTPSVDVVAKKTGVIGEKKAKAEKKSKESVKSQKTVKSEDVGQVERVEEVKGDPNYLRKTALKCAFAGLVIGTGILYYMRYLSPSDAIENQGAQNTSEVEGPIPLPTNICTIPEYAELCKGNLGILRIDMPQILGDVQKYFLGNYSIEGIDVFQTTMPASGLTPIQGEMNTQKIMSMIDAHTANRFNVCEEPILITAGDVNPTTGSPIYYVADGHHRFAACSLMDLPMQVVAIKDLAANVLAKAMDFPGVFTAGL